MTSVRTRFYPLVLVSALFTLGGCGLFIEESPTDATLATLNGMRAITEAIGKAVLPDDLSDTTLPYAATGSGTLGQGELEEFGRTLVQALGGTSQRMAAVDFVGDPEPCAEFGSVALSGSADVTDGRNIETGWGNITIQFTGMSAVAAACEGYLYRSTGSVTASADDTITVSAAALPDWDRWHFQRNESATGNLTIVKVYPGTSHTVSFSWQRVGTLDLNVKRDTFDLEPLGQSQTLYLTVNGQTCTGYSTGSLFIQYNWDCSGG